MPANDSPPPDEDIPLQGTHRGDTDDPITSSVRAQEPAVSPPSEASDATEASATAGAPDGANDLQDYRLSHDSGSGRYRMRVDPPKEKPEAPGGGFRELSRHSSPGEMSDALDGQLSDGPRFVVLENTETGEAFFDREGALSGDLFADGRFDQVTVFEREEEAAAYADEQKRDS